MAVSAYRGADARLISLSNQMSRVDAEMEEAKTRRPADRPAADVVAKAAELRARLSEAIARQPKN